MRRYRKYLLIALLQMSIASQAQELTLDSAYAMARAHYPLSRQKELVAQTAALTIENLAKGYLPQLSVNGQASYQSEVTAIEIPLPGFKVNPPSKDQYRLTADLSQVLYDGGQIRAQQEWQRLNATTETQKLEVELYKLRERVNQLFLGVLLLDAQIRQVRLVQADITNGLRKAEAQVAQGVAYRSALNSVRADSLKTEQRLIELVSARKSLLNILSVFTGRQLDENVQLAMPESPAGPRTIARPELDLFKLQQGLVERQKRLTTTRIRPKISAFVQGGYGRPGLNMLKNEFDLFYIAGLRLNWSLTGWYTYRNDRTLLDITQRGLAIQEEAFLLHTNSQLVQQQTEIDKYEQLLSGDREIIELRKSVKEAALAQLANGVITTADYLREVNAEDQARTQMILHQLQLLSAKINYQTITGK